MRYKILSCIVLVSLVYSSCKNHENINKPNIVLINIDDLGWKDVSFMGSKYYETPHIDALSSRGMIYKWIRCCL